MGTWAWTLIGAAVAFLLGWIVSSLRKGPSTARGEVPAVPALQQHPSQAEADRRAARDVEIIHEAATEDDPGNALADLPRRDL